MVKKAAWVLAVVLILSSCFVGCNDEPFRLHIIANSDSKEDQSVKLKVRDDILKLVNDDMKKVNSKKGAEEYIKSNLEILEKKAKETLENNQMPYGAKAVIGRFEFPEKTYGQKTYPAGEYDALRIVLGDGKGKNWWCVMFPPLCLMELEDGEKRQLKDADVPDKIEYKSFFGDLFKDIFGGS